MLKDDPIFSKFEKKNLKKSFFQPKNSARSWAATKKWSLECLGVNVPTLHISRGGCF